MAAGDLTEQINILLTLDDNQYVSTMQGVGPKTETELNKVAGDAAVAGSNAGKGFGDNFGKVAIAGFAGLQAAVATLGTVSFGKGAAEDAVALARANAALGAEIQSVGAQSGVTGASIDALANRIQKTDAIYQATTKSAASLLLPLDQIKNQAGDGNNIFDRTLTVSAAIANVFGKDMTQSAVQLGRALENPATAMNALQRSGIALSQQTRDQILQFAKHGDILSAQKVLLSELEARYVSAGQAIAKADPFQQFNVSMTQFKTQVGKDVLPAITALLDEGTQLLSLFSKIPAPIRYAAEALAAYGIAALTISKIGTVVNTVGTIAGNTSTIAESSSSGVATGATQAQGSAATGAAVQNTSLAKALAAVAEAATAASETLAGLAEQYAGLGEQAATVGTQAAGGAEQLSLFGENAVASSEGVASLTEQLSLFDEAASAGTSNGAGQLSLFGDAATASAEGVAGLTEQLLLFDEAVTSAGPEAEGAVAGIAALGESATGSATGVAALTEQLGLFDATIAGAGAGNGAAAAEMAGVGKAAADAGTEVASAGEQLSLFGEEAATTSEALTGLDEQLALFGVNAAGAVAGVSTLEVSLGGLNAEAAQTEGSMSGLGFSFGSLIPILGGAVAGFTLVEQALHTQSRAIDDTQEHLQRFAKEVNQYENADFWGILFHPRGTSQAQSDIKKEIQDLENILNGSGTQAAQNAYAHLLETLQDSGASVGQINSVQEALVPFLNDLQSAEATSNGAAGGITNLSDAFGTLAANINGATADLTIADSFDAIDAAQKKVVADYQDLAGTSDKAISAAQGVRDANQGVVDAEQSLADANQRIQDSYQAVADAQDRVNESLHRLAEAQKALDDYNSARSAEERALQQDIIERRVVTTPAEEDQKQLDLLRLQDENAQKQQQLQDAVANALRGVRDANKGLEGAIRGVSQAEEEQAKAVAKVQDAHDKVTQAIEKQKKVHEDAAASIVSDQRKVQEALGETVQKIEDAIQKGQLSNDEVIYWGALLDGVAGKYSGPLSTAVQTFFDNFERRQIQALANEITFDRVYNLFASALGAQQASLPAVSPEQRLWLHALGVPGFDEGGVVPGAVGAPQPAIVHGGELVLTPDQQRQARSHSTGSTSRSLTINQTNHFAGDSPSTSDLEFANRQLGWSLTGGGRY